MYRRCFNCGAFVYRVKPRSTEFGFSECSFEMLPANHKGGYKNKYCCEDCYKKFTSQS